MINNLIKLNKINLYKNNKIINKIYINNSNNNRFFKNNFCTINNNNNNNQINFNNFKNFKINLINNFPNLINEKEKFFKDLEQDEKYSFLKTQKTIEYKGLLDKFRFPSELYQDELDGINQEEQEEEQEYVGMDGLKATIHSKSGSVYEGQVTEKGIPHGYGELESKNGDFYIGQFVNGKKEGRGRLMSVSGCTYDGDWKDDMHWGEGNFEHPEEQLSFQGSWVANERNGPGVMSDPKVEIKGIWENDRLIFGHEIKKNSGVEYYGEWENDQWNGNGKLLFPDGSIYYGQFKDGTLFGKGKFLKLITEFDSKTNEEVVVDEQIVENDDWRNGIICGTGKIYNKNWCCEGTWLNGKISFATITTRTIDDSSNTEPKVNIYKGEIDPNSLLPNGKGEEFLENGEYFNGHFIEGKREGLGCAVYSDGTSFDGNWIRGLRYGKGKIESDQFDIDADFKEMISNTNNNNNNNNSDNDNNDYSFSNLFGKGTIKNKLNNSIYIGEFENGLPEGYGQLKTINNNNNNNEEVIKKGIWNKGILIKEEK